MWSFPRQKLTIYDIGIIAGVIAATVVTYICLSNRINDIFLFFWLIPVVLIAYSRPRSGIYGTVFIGWLYIALVWVWGLWDSQLFALAAVRFCIFVSTGVLISVYYQDYHKGKKRNSADMQLQKGKEPSRQTASALHETGERLRAIAEKDYHSILENIQDVFYRTDADGNLILISPSGAKLLGYPGIDEMIGRSVTECYVDPVQREFFLATLKKEGSVSNIETTLKRKDGSLVTVSTSSHIYYDAHGGYAGVEGIFHDITARKRAEDNLVRQIQAIDASIDGIAILDADQKYVFLNKAHVKIYGYDSPDELLGKSWRVLYDNDELRRFDKEVIPAFGKHGYYRGTFTGKKKDKSTFAQELSLTALENGGLICVVHDITERKRAERALAESEEKFRSVFNNANDEIYIHGIRPDGFPGNFIEVNSTMCTMLGYTREELLGMTVRDIVSEAHKKKMPDIARIFDTAGYNTFTAEHRRKDGTIFPVEVNIHIFTFSGRKIALGIARDITERKHSEQAAELANRKLNLMNNITRHNIINILTGLFGSVDAALAAEDRQERDEFLRQIKDRAGMIQQEMDFNIRYEEVGVHEPVWQKVREVVSRVAPSFKRPGILIENDLDWTEIYADPVFEKVVYILLDNAIQHGGKVTTIRFRSRFNNSEFLISCEDDGVGIPAEKKEKIFLKREGSYHGTELFLVREILAITGITIRETGDPGKGARFEITVPNGVWRVTGQK